MTEFSIYYELHKEFIEMAIELRRYAQTHNLPKDLIVYGVSWDIRGLVEKKFGDFVFGGVTKMTDREPFAKLEQDEGYTHVCAGDYRIYSTREVGGAHLDVEGINAAFEKAVSKREAEAFNAGLELAARMVEEEEIPNPADECDVRHSRWMRELALIIRKQNKPTGGGDDPRTKDRAAVFPGCS